MNEAKTFDFDIELRKGIRNFWYPVCQVGAVGKKPIGLTRLGTEIVLWREESGKLNAQDDTCLHRGARLSQGEVSGKVLSCSYHGWSYDGHGRCISIPASHDANRNLAPKLKLTTYACQEKAGLIWVYFPEKQEEQLPPLVLPEELASPEWGGFICEVAWDVNWILVLENLADPMHGPFLHGKSLTLRHGDLEDEMRTIREDDGFIVERVGQQGINFDRAEFFWSDTLWVRLDIPLPWGPKGVLRIFGMVTPIDGESSLVYFLRYRKLSGLKKAYWRFMYRYVWERQHAWVIDQDRKILKSQRGTQSRQSENLANSDRGVNELRRFLQDRAAAQQGSEN